MKITENKSNIPNRAIRRMISWVCRQAKMPVSLIDGVMITRAGTSRTSAHRTCEDKLNLWLKVPPEWRRINDSYLIYSVAWYVCKERKRQNGGKHGVHWDSADTIQRTAKAKLDELNKSWLKPDKREAPPDKPIEIGFANPADVLGAFERSKWEAKKSKAKKSRKQINAERAEKNLRNWERKLKLAQTKVRKYRASVRRYEREGVLEPEVSNER
jgi:hypothetical protein